MISAIRDFLFFVVAAKLRHLCSSPALSSLSVFFLQDTAVVASVNKFSVLSVAREDRVGKSLAWG